jgi:hypothetical protein
MKYLPEIVWLLTWPLLIVICYYLVIFALEKYEKGLEKTRNESLE